MLDNQSEYMEDDTELQKEAMRKGGLGNRKSQSRKGKVARKREPAQHADHGSIRNRQDVCGLYTLQYICCAWPLRQNRFVACSRSKLVGSHCGETAIKVEKLVESASGGMLFIDESYSLLNGTGSNSRDEFGHEAVNELVNRMCLSKCIFVFAGYERETRRILEINPGFISRFQFQFNLEPYKPEEVVQIFKKQLKDRKWSMDKKTESFLIRKKYTQNFIWQRNRKHSVRGDHRGGVFSVQVVF